MAATLESLASKHRQYLHQFSNAKWDVQTLSPQGEVVAKWMRETYYKTNEMAQARSVVDSHLVALMEISDDASDASLEETVIEKVNDLIITSNFVLKPDQRITQLSGSLVRKEVEAFSQLVDRNKKILIDDIMKYHTHSTTYARGSSFKYFFVTFSERGEIVQINSKDAEDRKYGEVKEPLYKVFFHIFYEDSCMDLSKTEFKTEDYYPVLKPVKDLPETVTIMALQLERLLRKEV